MMGRLVSEAKAFVRESKTWADYHPSRFREVARRIAEAWGIDNTSAVDEDEEKDGR